MDAYNFKIPSYEEDSLTYKMRHQISIDSYARFKWRGVDSYDSFGCFIINNKNLQWVNYASFSDEFSKPMFSSSVQHVGTTFSQKELSLTLGAYWLTHEDYRALVNWLSPEVIGNFEFGYNAGWEYNVKITSFSNSTYYSIGYNESGETVYYAEFTIKLKTIATNAVTCVNPWQYKKITNEDEVRLFFLQNKDSNSELSTSIDYYDSIQFQSNLYYEVSLCRIEEGVSASSPSEITQWDPIEVYPLFNFTTTDSIIDLPINISYNSEKGLLLVNNHLISENEVSTTGVPFISTYNVYKNIIPGTLNNQAFSYYIPLIKDGLATITFHDMFGETCGSWEKTIKNGEIIFEKTTGYATEPPQGQKWVTKDNSLYGQILWDANEYAIPSVVNSTSKFYFSIGEEEDHNVYINLQTGLGRCKYTVNWGDDSEIEEYDTTSAQSLPAFRSHEYATDGNFEIQINILIGSLYLISNGMNNAFTLHGIATQGQSANVTTYGNENLNKCIIGHNLFLSQYAFANLTSLEQIVLTDQTLIPQWCFYQCSNLSFINWLTPTVGEKSIEQKAFYDCDSLTDILLTENTNVNPDAFDNTHLNSVVITNFSAGEHLFITQDNPSQLNVADKIYNYFIRIRKIVGSSAVQLNTDAGVSIFSKRQL